MSLPNLCYPTRKFRVSLGVPRTALLIALACLGLLSSKAIAQPVAVFESKVQNANATDYSRSKSCLGAAGGMFVVSLVGEFTDKNNPQRFQVTRVDSNGTVANKFLVDNLGNLQADTIGKFLPTPDGGVVVSLYFDDQGYGWAHRLAKINANGALQWIRVQNAITEVFVAPDGSIFVSDVYEAHGTTNGPAVVTKISADGQTVWSETVNIDGSSAVMRLSSDGNGGVNGFCYVNGLVWHEDDSSTNYKGIAKMNFNGAGENNGSYVTPTKVAFPNLSPYLNTIDASGNLYLVSFSTGFVTFSKVDAQGNEAWSKPFSIPISNHSYLGIDGLGNPILTGHYADQQTGTGPGFIMKVDSSGNLLWTKQILGTNGKGVATNFASDTSGNIMLATEIAGGASGTDIGIIKYFPNGDLGWPSLPNGMVVFPSTYSDHIGDIHRDAGGALYLAGYYNSYPDTGVSGLIAAKYAAIANASFNSQSVPTTMIAGQTYSVAERLLNTGALTWTKANGDYLRSANSVDNKVWGVNRIDLGAADAIANSQAKNFGFNVIAPMTAGNYNFQWRMSQNSHSFGAFTANKVINVVVNANAARYTGQNVPTSVKAGSTFTVTVYMMNVGTTAWTSAAGFGLAPSAGSWGVTKVAMSATDSIARGATKVFTFTCTAPSTPGSYPMGWQMRRDSPTFTGAFGDISSARTITVTP